MTAKDIHHFENATVRTPWANNTMLQDVRGFGGQTQVPEDDHSRLAYYLKCVSIGCGIDFVFDETLLDYANVGQRSKWQEGQLCRLCVGIFKLDYLLNHVVFVDTSTLQVGNYFCEIKDSVCVGNTSHVQKVMLCTPQWIEAYYHTPMINLGLVHNPNGSKRVAPLCGIVCDPYPGQYITPPGERRVPTTPAPSYPCMEQPDFSSESESEGVDGEDEDEEEESAVHFVSNY